jgi:hypothetical protein
MESLISLPLSVFAELLRSHSKLAQAEYDRNPSYNDSHFSYKAEEKVIEYLEKNGEWEAVSVMMIRMEQK